MAIVYFECASLTSEARWASSVAGQEMAGELDNNAALQEAARQALAFA